MLFDFAALPASDRYKLLTATIVPRPIAWLVTQDAAGGRNAAPYSFFNAVSDDPPLVMVSIGRRDSATGKDSGANIRATGEFVICLVPHARVEAMHVTAIGFPPGTDELAEAGLATLPSHFVAPPRIEASPVAMECVLHQLVDIAPGRTLALGRVVAMHVADAAMLDRARCHVDTPKLDLIGRTYGGGGYVRATGPGSFTEPRITLAEWQARPE